MDINFFSDRPIVSDTQYVSSQILAPVIGNIYKSLRNLALVLMMLVVLYIGIKIMISSVAAQQAKYKQLLVDWLVGFALLFMMHYIMSGIVAINSIVVDMISNEEGDSYYVGFADLQDNWTGSDSQWYDIMTGGSSQFQTYHKQFIRNDVIIKDSKSDTDGFTINSDGSLDLKSVKYRKHDQSPTPDVDWGQMKEDKQIIYIAATIFNNSNDNEKFKNRAIIKMNTMSYVRTVSSFGLVDEDHVKIYNNKGLSKVTDVDIMGYGILYLALVVETMMFGLTYIKRVLQMAFLTMVAPIVAIMYPVDKIGDGKAQAFNTWFKDYLFNILIQPMHLLLYTIFIVAASELAMRNIIYALAVYGFMIPSEKYFKKILGFEKAPGGGGGPMSNAIGRSLAMDGLGKIAGFGPAARHGGGGSGGSGKKAKIGKNTPSDPSGLNPLGGGDSDTGNGRGNPLSSGGRAGGRRNINPLAPPGSKQGLIKSALMTGGNRIMRAATGGKYDNLHRVAGDFRDGRSFKEKAGVIGKVAGATGLNALKFAGKGAVKAASMAAVGGLGVMAGTATAMTTGDVSNIWKGAAVGAGAGNKLYDRGADALSAFSDEVKAERAANDEEYNAKYQYKMNQELNKEDLDALSLNERKGIDKIMEKYSGCTGPASVDDFKALKAIENKANNSADPSMHIDADNTKTGKKALDYSKRFKNSIYTDPDKVRRSISKDYGYDSSIAPGNPTNDAAKAKVDMMMELIEAGADKLK